MSYIVEYRPHGGGRGVAKRRVTIGIDLAMPRQCKSNAKQPPQRGRPWPKGTSGNPRGMAKGTRHHRTLLIEQLSGYHVDDLIALDDMIIVALAEYFGRREAPTRLDVELAVKISQAVVRVIKIKLKRRYERKE